MSETLYVASAWILPILFAVTLHEAAHGFVALRFGDRTALMANRVSLNPLRHVDPFGTVILPALLLFASGGRMMFGFAKPVPVDFANLRNPRRDMIWVALAGPGTNLLLLLISGLAMYSLWLMPEEIQQWAFLNFYNSMWINALLAVFNMLPIPPLDGGRVAVGLLPLPLAMKWARLERAGIFIVLGAIFLLPFIGNQFGFDLNVFWWLVGTPAQFLMDRTVDLLNLISIAPAGGQ